MRRKHIILFIVTMFITWNMLMYFTIVRRPAIPEHEHAVIEHQLNSLRDQIEIQLKENEKIMEDLRKFKDQAAGMISNDPPLKLREVKEQKSKLTNDVVTQLPPNGSHNRLDYGKVDPDTVILPILMIACNRKDAVKRSLDLVLKFRPDKDRFPIIVSQDCGDQGTSDTIQQYVKQHGVTHIKQPDLGKIDLAWPQRKFEGYYKISRHYKWALTQVFQTFNHSAVIIVEDDLDIAPDFFEYFAATYRILSVDPTLWCVSAWNDNGKGGMVKDDPELLHRTDFFPGLGWMMDRKLWQELGPKWPATFWDDWMRHPDQRKGRSCIRPEICRTSTFGKVGISKGLFYEKHLKFIQLNNKYVPFTKKDLSYLIKDNYDPKFEKEIYFSTPEVSANEVYVGQKPDKPDVRLTYRTKPEFVSIATKLGIMQDFKAGVARTAYRGVVSTMFKGQRVHVAPPLHWKGYDPTWT